MSVIFSCASDFTRSLVSSFFVSRLKSWPGKPSVSKD
jgi:hypothetical protein